MLILTFDTDWAPPEVMEDLFQLLESYDLKATFFCTDDNPKVPSQHEVAIHPNFLKYTQETAKDAIAPLLQNYSGVIGTRSHSLHNNSWIAIYQRELGLKYTSNYVMYNVPNIQPIELYGMKEYPIFFMDDYYFMYHVQSIENEKKFSIDSIDILSEGLKVLVFHPIHIFVNTRSMEEFNAGPKKHYQEPQKLLSFRNEGSGIRSMFIELLEKIKSENIKCTTLKEFHASI